jgi:hypothetical protein
MTTLNKMSYNISCDHIKQLNEKYTANNDRLFKEKFICFNNEDDYNNNNKNGYLKNMYISRKDCIYKSTEPDEFKWADAFINTNKNNKCIDYTTKLFNENTRRKILTKY